MNSGNILRRRIFSALKTVLFIIVLWYVGLSLSKSIQEIDWSSLTFRCHLVVLGTLISFSSILLGSWIHRGVFQRLHSELLWTQAFVLLTVPPIGKYIPGKVLAIAGYVSIARLFGIGIMQSGSVSILLMGLGLNSTLVTGLILMYVGHPHMEIFRLREICIIILFMCFFLHPRIYWSIVNLMLRAVKQPRVAISFSLLSMVTLFFKLLLQNSLYLCGVSVMVMGVVDLPASMIPSLTGISCVAYVVGFLAIFAPAGIGVREGVFLVLLTPLVGSGTAAIVAVMMRFFQTILDFLSASVGGIVFQLWKTGRCYNSDGINNKKKKTPHAEPSDLEREIDQRV